MPIRDAFDRVGHVVDVFCTEKATSGGSIETPTVNDEATMPSRTPSTSAARATTPDGKYEKVVRRSCESGEYGVSAMIESFVGVWINRDTRLLNSDYADRKIVYQLVHLRRERVGGPAFRGSCARHNS